MAVWFSHRVLMAVCVIAGAHATSAMAKNIHVLHVFCRDLQCGDGGSSTMSMVMDTAGNLYGTAADGSHGAGVVFELSPPQTGETKWAYHVLYNFCSRNACKDGADPTNSTLIRDTSGNLYGTTAVGGSRDSGTAFMLSPQTKVDVEPASVRFLSGMDRRSNDSTALLKTNASELRHREA
ncbi:MAG TPA: choice-of-anchor tandem repeat GloVer-containing protein [Rhizomicrobium sp.]|nr:choice-of-anchor tandem repeat GloVer-containing protein [Rhizomicrobium sp.]